MGIGREGTTRVSRVLADYMACGQAGCFYLRRGLEQVGRRREAVEGSWAGIETVEKVCVWAAYWEFWWLVWPLVEQRVFTGAGG